MRKEDLFENINDNDFKKLTGYALNDNLNNII